MSRAPRIVRAGEFKAQCLALIDDVAASRREVVITKRGKPLAKLVPLGASERVPTSELIAYQGDLLSPIDVTWDVQR